MMTTKTGYRELNDETFTPYLKAKCTFCGLDCDLAGIYQGSDDWVLCPNCLMYHHFNELGILIGDAVLEAYKRPYVRDKYPPSIVKDVLSRIEKAAYRAISAGLYQEFLNPKKV
jgi:hypothetical protein